MSAARRGCRIRAYAVLGEPAIDEGDAKMLTAADGAADDAGEHAGASGCASPSCSVLTRDNAKGVSEAGAGAGIFNEDGADGCDLAAGTTFAIACHVPCATLSAAFSSEISTACAGLTAVKRACDWITGLKSSPRGESAGEPPASVQPVPARFTACCSARRTRYLYALQWR